MASQAKVTLLIETKFEKFQELKKAGNELQEALGVGKIAKEYEKLDKSLGSILSKIKQINQASGKSGLLGGGGGGTITGAHGARGVGGAGVGGAIYGPQQSAWQQYAPGKATEAGFGQMHTVTATAKGQIRDQLLEAEGRRLSRTQQAQRNADLMATFGNEVYPGYQDRRYAGASPLRDPYATRTSDLRPAYAGVTTARAGVAGANVQQTINQRQQAGIKSQMEEAARLGQMEAAHMTEFFGPSGPPATQRAASAAAAQSRLQMQVAGVRDAGARANPIIGGALARGLRAASPEARAAALRSSQLGVARNVGGVGLFLGGAASAVGGTLMGTMGGAGGAGQMGGAIGSAGLGLAGGALGFMLGGGPLGAMAGATMGSMLGNSIGGTFGGIGGQVAQYGTKGLQFQEAAGGLAAMGLGAGTQGSLGAGTRGATLMLLGRRQVGKSRTVEMAGESLKDGARIERQKTIPGRVTRDGGLSPSLGYSVDQIAGMAGQMYGTAMMAPRSVAPESGQGRRELISMQQLQRGLGVGAETTGQMLFGLRRSGGSELRGFSEGLLTPGMSYGEQRGMFQLAGRMLGSEFARTGISGRATMRNIDSFTSQRGRSGFRAMQFAEGAVNYGRNIAQQGPQSPYDFALVSALADGGGVSPTKLLDIYKGLETGSILKPGKEGGHREQFMSYLKSVRGAAGGDKGLETITLNKALQPILPGLGLSATDKAMGMIEEGKSFDAIQGAFGDITRDSNLANLSGANVTKQMRRGASIRNDMITLGTEMMTTMQVFKEAAEMLAKAMKDTAPIMADIHRTVAENAAGMSMQRE
tara:strand:+ start:12077 stop:14521 length:2445 start_codon:yes stop_codon:yes gene_type:complete